MRVQGDVLEALNTEILGSTSGDTLEVSVWRGGELLVDSLDVTAWSLDWDGERQIQGMATLTVADPDGSLAPWGFGDALGAGGSRLLMSWVSGATGVRVPLGWWRIRQAEPEESWRVYTRPGAGAWSVPALYPSATPVVRTNLCVNPSMTTAITGWSKIPAGTLAAVGGEAVLTLGADLTASYLLVYTTALIPYTGEPVAMRLSIKHDRASSTDFRLVMLAYNSGGSGISGSVYGTPVAVGVGETVELTLPGSLLVNPDTAYLRLSMASTDPLANGDVITFDEVLIEEVAEVDDEPGTFFDGSFTDTAQYTYAWTGTEHLSTSTQTEDVGLFPALDLYPAAGASGWTDAEIVRVPGGGSVTLKADDEMSSADIARLDAEPVVESTCVAEITRLLEDICTVTVDDDVEDANVPGDLMYGESRTDAVEDLLDVLDATWRMGGDGAFEIVPAGGVTEPVWTIQGGVDGALIDLKRTISDDGVYNIAVSSSETEDGAPLIARAWKLGGPLAATGPFGPAPTFHNAVATTQAGVQADADTVLASATAREIDLPVTCLTHPALQVQDRVTVIAATRIGDQSLEGRVVGMKMRSVSSGGGVVPAKSMDLTVRVQADVLEVVARRVQRHG
jgi:hypothetical protein